MRGIAAFAGALTLFVQLILLLVVATALVSTFGAEYGWLVGLAIYAVAVFIWIMLLARYISQSASAPDS